jgi:hypothetical protein
MSILANKMPNLTENTKVLILFKLEEGWSIWGVAQDCNTAQNIVQRIKQTILIKYQRHFMLSYLTYIKRMTLKFQKGIFTWGKSCNNCIKHFFVRHCQNSRIFSCVNGF